MRPSKRQFKTDFFWILPGILPPSFASCANSCETTDESFTHDGNGTVKERWTQWDKLCEGADGPGPHRVLMTARPVAARPVLVAQQDRCRILGLDVDRDVDPAEKRGQWLPGVAVVDEDRLDAGEKAELQEAIEDHRRGIVPLIVPLTLLRHHLRRHGAPWLEGQTFLDPHPKELMLRNHA